MEARTCSGLPHHIPNKLGHPNPHHAKSQRPKFLYAFEIEDANIFFGRDAASEAFYQTILDNRLTVLHAKSGAGKTSLLNAGLSPRLIREGRLPVCARVYQDPVRAIKLTIAPPSLGPWPKLLPKLTLHEFLGRTCAHLSRQTQELVIILDQFEEIFIFWPERDRRQPFINVLADCYDDQAALPVRFVIALRKDYLSDLADFQERIPTILHNEYRLDALTRDEATQAIATPLVGTGMDWEPGAVEALLDYLDQGKIAPPHLQLICSRLYAAAKEVGQAVIRVAGVNLHSIHADYLVGEMSAPDFARRELGWRLLKRLVTSEGTKQILPLDKLYEVAPPSEVDPVLKRLVNRRLLRRNESEGETLLEVAHDTLAAEIAAHETGPERREKVARELVERELTNWRQFDHLMEAPILHVLDQYRDSLISPDAEALELLFRSALATGHEVPYWFERAREGDVPVDDIAREGLEAESLRTRAAAVAALGQLGERFVEPIIGMLADDYPQVRVAAIHALERLRPDGAWREHLVYECYVPAGTFIMGDDSSNKSDEKPAREVHLEAYYIGKYPVTNNEYKWYRDDVGQPFDVPEGKADHPVVSVSWYDARDYAAWARMRLLTEAEWEKAASWELESRGAEERGRKGGIIGKIVGAIPRDRPGGKKRKYPWGNEFDKSKCNTSESGIDDTTPVGKYSPDGDSPYDCADMAGNVWEWTSSLYKHYPYRVNDGREDMSSSDSRVVRGGSFFSAGSYARSAYRFRYDPDNRDVDFGFRVGVAAAPFSPRSAL